MYTCALCSVNSCLKGNIENAPKNCPGLEMDRENILPKYSDGENYRLAHKAALVEAEGYCVKTRLEEIMDFANKCGFKNLGLAFCIGLKKEAKVLHKILAVHGFAVNSVVCKNGGVPKESINIEENQKVDPGSFEAMCNPIGQAEHLNRSQTDLNILLGLCVGHDSLFIKHSNAPVTVFAVKDRVLGHNPLAAIYLAQSYYQKKLFPQEKK